MNMQRRGTLSRRLVLAGLPAGFVSGATATLALAQPSAADPVSFYLGQVLALATLQAQAVDRLQPLLAQPNAGDALWQGDANAEAGVIGAVAGIIAAMEPPAELTDSVGELRLASAAYRSAAEAARLATGGDLSQLPAASANLAQGASHILLWLTALTDETGNDWGDGLRTLVENSAATVAPAADEAAAPAEAVATSEVVIDEPATDETAPDASGNQGNNGGQGNNGQNQNKKNANKNKKKNQNQDQSESAS